MATIAPRIACSVNPGCQRVNHEALPIRFRAVEASTSRRHKYVRSPVGIARALSNRSAIGATRSYQRTVAATPEQEIRCRYEIATNRGWSRVLVCSTYSRQVCNDH